MPPSLLFIKDERGSALMSETAVYAEPARLHKKEVYL